MNVVYKSCEVCFWASTVKGLLVLRLLSTEEELTLTVKGSYEEAQKISLDTDFSLGNRDSITFHCVKNNQTKLDVTLPKMMHYDCVGYP